MKLQLLALLALLPLTSLAGNLVFSYDTGEKQQFVFGTDKRETYDIAMRLHAAELGGAQIKEIRIPISAAVARMKDCQVWASTTLDGDHNLWTQDVTPDPETRLITVALPEGINVEADDVYLGFTFGLTATNKDTRRPVVAVYGSRDEGRCYIRCSLVGGKWTDLGPNGPFDLCMQALLGNMPDNGAWPDQIKRVDQAKDTPLVATVDVRNTGAAGLHLLPEKLLQRLRPVERIRGTGALHGSQGDNRAFHLQRRAGSLERRRPLARPLRARIQRQPGHTTVL